MSEQDALIERVAQAMWDQKEQRNRAILGGEDGSLYECVPFADGEDSDTAWWVENARAAIAAVRDAEGLDALLERHNITDIHCVRLRMDDHEVTPRWRAYLSRDHIVSAERMWAGEGPTRDAAIRAAITDALAGEGAS